MKDLTSYLSHIIFKIGLQFRTSPYLLTETTFSIKFSEFLVLIHEEPRHEFYNVGKILSLVSNTIINTQL